MPKPVTPHSESPFCSPVQGAAYIGVDVRTIYRWIADHRLTAYRAGSHRIRIRKTDLEAVLTQVSE